MTKRCYALRHVPFESLGLLQPLLEERGFEVELIDVPRSMPDAHGLEQAELLVILGGPVSAYQEDVYPQLRAELQVLEARLRDGKATLGICLGAQLLARALGARVYPGTRKEIGWAPLTLTEAGRQGPLGAIEGQSVLHWHGDTFDMPAGANLLASTPATPHQAFSWQRAVALQFHLEVSAAALEAWYFGHACELSHWREATIPELRAQGHELAPLLEPHARRALGGLLDQLLVS